MASDALNIEFAPGEWSHQVERDLRSIAAHSARDISAFRDLIEGGEMDLLEVRAGGERVGCLVWSVCHEHDGPVMVINAFAARLVKGVSLSLLVMRRFQAFAEATGCKRVRCWTKRAGLVRIIEGKGGCRAWHVMEIDANGRF